MGTFARLMLSTMVLPFMNACAPSGKCTTSAGTVDTYTPLGRWQKIAGYNPPKTAGELELNYDFLIVEPGTNVCLTRVQSGASVSSVYNGTYTANYVTKVITLVEPQASATKSAHFSFSGTCNTTQMTFTYTDGTTPETYQLLSADTKVGDCNPTN